MSEEKKRRAHKKKYPLSDIMHCLKCGEVMHAIPGKTKIYYRCGNSAGVNKTCKTPSIAASIIEDKIKGIVIENLKNFYVVDNQKYTEEEKQSRFIKLLKNKRECINILPDGIHPVINYTKGGAIHNLPDLDFEIKNIDDKIKRLNNNTFVVFGDWNLEGKLKEYHKKQEELLLSDNYTGINELYKRYITVWINLEEKNGLIYFLLSKEKFPEDPFYKFSY